MGERQNQPFQLCFNASLRVDFQGSRVTSDGGLILVREFDERLGFSELIEQHLADSQAKNTRLGRARPAQRLRRTAKTSRTTIPKGPARLAVDPTGQEA